jgi:hypothetical protein
MITRRMVPFRMNIGIIHTFAFVLILPPDSNVESSNITGLVSGLVFPVLDTAQFQNVPAVQI